MQILVFADTYDEQRVPMIECEIVVILGNVSKRVVTRINDLYKGRAVLLGLHSNVCPRDLYNGTEIFNFHEQVVEVKGRRFAGFSGVVSADNDEYGYFTQQEAQRFVNQLGVSDVDALFSYSHPPYGDIPGAHAKDGVTAFNDIFTKNLTKHVIHGRLHQNLKRTIGKVNIHMVYPYQVIKID